MIDLQRSSERKGHNGSIYQLFPAGETGFYSVAGDGWLVHWPMDDPELGKMVAKVEGGQLYSMLAVPEEELLLAGALDGGLHWLYPDNPEANLHLAHHKKGIYAIIQVGEFIFCGGGDGVLSKWSLTTGRVVESLPLSTAAIRSLCFYASQNKIYAGCSDHHIYLLDPDTMTVEHYWKAHENSVFCLAISEDKSKAQLTSSGRDARIKRWQLSSQGIPVETLKNIPAHNSTINDLAYSPDGNYLATASRDKTLRLWDAHSLQLLKVIEPIRDRGHVNSINSLLWLTTDRLVTAGDDRRILEFSLLVP